MRSQVAVRTYNQAGEHGAGIGSLLPDRYAIVQDVLLFWCQILSKIGLCFEVMHSENLSQILKRTENLTCILRIEDRISKLGTVRMNRVLKLQGIIQSSTVTDEPHSCWSYLAGVFLAITTDLWKKNALKETWRFRRKLFFRKECLLKTAVLGWWLAGFQ